MGSVRRVQVASTWFCFAYRLLLAQLSNLWCPSERRTGSERREGGRSRGQKQESHRYTFKYHHEVRGEEKTDKWDTRWIWVGFRLLFLGERVFKVNLVSIPPRGSRRHALVGREKDDGDLLCIPHAQTWASLVDILLIHQVQSFCIYLLCQGYSAHLSSNLNFWYDILGCAADFSNSIFSEYQQLK